jgi:predicted ATP-binding protein involved in virulence
MHIDRISVENFKNFEKLELDLAQGVNLFVGTNGSGKTAILEALCVAAGGFFATREQKMQRGIEFNEIQMVPTTEVSQLETGAFVYRKETATVKAFSNELDGWWSRTLKRDTKTNDTKFLKVLSNYGVEFYKRFQDNGDRNIAPVISYYSTQRLFNDSNQSQKQKIDGANGRANGYIQCLEEKAIKQQLIQWLEDASTFRANMFISGRKIITDKTLDAIESAIKETFIDFMQLSPKANIRLLMNPKLDNEIFIQLDSFRLLPISYYSDGFRNLLFLIIDLVWRASTLNPWLSYDELKNLSIGVVMIDEIDLHLHPTWQSKAISLLQKLFPNIQFFISTHSPTVVANFEKGTLYVIDGVDNAIIRYPGKYFGKEVNDVLVNVLQANDRHVLTQSKIDKLLSLIDNNVPDDQYDSLLNELIGLLGKEDAEIQHILSLIEWQKIQNQEANGIHK